jgi:cytochrome c oxidase subunit 3
MVERRVADPDMEVRFLPKAVKFLKSFRLITMHYFIKNFSLKFSNQQYHTFHLVDPSPWPFMAAMSGLAVTSGGVMYMHGFSGGFFSLIFGLSFLTFILFMWWRDVVREATFGGHHTKAVQKSHRLGFILFIVSEVMFFFGFFWAFFHSSLAPTVEIGCIWPPAGITPFNPWGVPLLNTCILLLSGVTITSAHHYIIRGDSEQARMGFIGTIVLALAFTALQVLEYVEAPFNISDGIYGSTFYMATGFHGFHVIIGTSFIFYSFIRMLLSHFTKTHHFGFEAAAWYWHFVDVVWLFLFVSIYWWGGIGGL